MPWERTKIFRDFSPRALRVSFHMNRKQLEDGWILKRNGKKKEQVSFLCFSFSAGIKTQLLQALTSFGRINNDVVNPGFYFFSSSLIESWHRRRTKFHVSVGSKNETKRLYKLYWLYVNPTIRGQWHPCFRSVYQFCPNGATLSRRILRALSCCLHPFDTFRHTPYYTWEIIEFFLRLQLHPLRSKKNFALIRFYARLMTCWYETRPCAKITLWVSGDSIYASTNVKEM